MRWPGVPLVLMFVFLTQFIVCQEQQTPGYEEQLRVWLSIKEQLSGPNGEQYFENVLKEALIPGGVLGVHAFEGTLVSSAPAEHPKEFLVAMPGEKTPEVTLKLDGDLEKPLSAGSPVSFEGVVKAFTREPFMLTFEVETVNRAARPKDQRNDKKNSK